MRDVLPGEKQNKCILSIANIGGAARRNNSVARRNASVGIIKANVRYITGPQKNKRTFAIYFVLSARVSAVICVPIRSLQITSAPRSEHPPTRS